MGWLKEHLDTFVKPYLGFIPEVKKDDVRFFSTVEVVLLKNAWRQAKQEAKRLGCPILIPGRDVYVFHVLAMREGYTNAIFRPDISADVRDYVKEDYRNTVCIDTGYSGSIPKKLQCKSWLLLSHSGCSGQDVYHAYGTGTAKDSYGQPYPVKAYQLLKTEPHQFFPRSKTIRSIASKLEGSPKYWERALWNSTKNQPEQKLNPNKKAFEAAARMTIQLYTDSSPAYLEHPEQKVLWSPYWQTGSFTLPNPVVVSKSPCKCPSCVAAYASQNNL